MLFIVIIIGMADEADLFLQISQALQNNDIQTFCMLMQGQSMETISRLKSYLTNEVLILKLDQYLQKHLIDSKNKAQFDKNKDKIRQINQALYKQSSDESDNQNILQKELKTKKEVRMQRRNGYMFYGNVKCLMIAYGDLKPLEASIKMMHSEVEVLFQIVSQYIKKIVQTATKQKQKLSVNLLEQLFEQESQLFNQITKQCKKVRRATKKNEQISSESQLLSDQSRNDSDHEQQKWNADHMQSSTIDESEYFALLTKNMCYNDYESYSACRSVNFMDANFNKKNAQASSKGFIKFVSLIQYIKPTMHNVGLVSFICCRFVRKVVFSIIKQRNDGKLDLLSAPVTEDQIRKVGNSIIKDYESRISQLNILKMKPVDKAKLIFVQDFKDQTFKALFPRKIVNENKDAEAIWNSCPQFRELWTQKYIGEAEIDKQLQSGASFQQIEASTDYGKYILKNFEYYRSKGPSWLWKKYFTQEDVKEQIQQKVSIGKPRKRTKLESLQS